jgi:hypothetical protein
MPYSRACAELGKVQSEVYFMNNSLLIDPKTGEEYISVPPKVAAEFLGVAITFIYNGLQQGRLPIGAAAQGAKGVWSYNIPIQRLKTYAAGIDVSLLAQMNAAG